MDELMDKLIDAMARAAAAEKIADYALKVALENQQKIDSFVARAAQFPFQYGEQATEPVPYDLGELPLGEMEDGLDIPSRGKLTPFSIGSPMSLQKPAKDLEKPKEPQS